MTDPVSQADLLQHIKRDNSSQLLHFLITNPEAREYLNADISPELAAKSGIKTNGRAISAMDAAILTRKPDDDVFDVLVNESHLVTKQTFELLDEKIRAAGKDFAGAASQEKGQNPEAQAKYKLLDDWRRLEKGLEAEYPGMHSHDKEKQDSMKPHLPMSEEKLDANWEKAALASNDIKDALKGVTEAAKQAKLYEDSHHIVRNEKTGQVDFGTKKDEPSKPEYEEILNKLGTTVNIAFNKLVNKDDDALPPHDPETRDLLHKATAAGIKMATESEAHASELKSPGTGGAKPVPEKGQTTPR